MWLFTKAPWTGPYKVVKRISDVHVNEQQKRKAYDERVHDVEMGCFSPLVLISLLLVRSCRPTTNAVLNRVASCIATHQGEVLYSQSLLALLSLATKIFCCTG